MKELIARLKKLSGTEKYVLLIQAASLLPLLYFIIGSGEAVTYTSEGIPSYLFKLGMAFLSRAEVTESVYTPRVRDPKGVLYSHLWRRPASRMRLWFSAPPFITVTTPFSSILTVVR